MDLGRKPKTLSGSGCDWRISDQGSPLGSAAIIYYLSVLTVYSSVQVKLLSAP